VGCEAACGSLAGRALCTLPRHAISMQTDPLLAVQLWCTRPQPPRGLLANIPLPPGEAYVHTSRPAPPANPTRPLVQAMQTGVCLGDPAVTSGVFDLDKCPSL